MSKRPSLNRWLAWLTSVVTTGVLLTAAAYIWFLSMNYGHGSSQDTRIGYTMKNVQRIPADTPEGAGAALVEILGGDAVAAPADPIAALLLAPVAAARGQTLVYGGEGSSLTDEDFTAARLALLNESPVAVVVADTDPALPAAYAAAHFRTPVFTLPEAPDALAGVADKLILVAAPSRLVGNDALEALSAFGPVERVADNGLYRHALMWVEGRWGDFGWGIDQNFDREGYYYYTLANPADPGFAAAGLPMSYLGNYGPLLYSPQGDLDELTGDGGGANDEDMGHVDDWFDTNNGGNGQDLSTNLLGTILRIDVDSQTGDKAYGVPSDNPFVGQQGAEEVWAYGFRNPWRVTFDSQTGDLYAADLGQELYEEVDLVQKGGNYGWNVKEGAHCFSTQSPEEPPAECPSSTPDGAALIDPVLEQDHEVGIAIIGGGIYRGSAIPGLEGRYVFGNHSVSEENSQGNLLAATPTQDGLWSFEPISLTSSPDGLLGEEEQLLSFGQDLNGELYVLTKSVEGPKGNTGKVYRLAAAQ